MTIHPTLDQVVIDLNNQQVTTSQTHTDGRVNSIKDEETIIETLRLLYGKGVETPKDREWFDVRLFGIPVQIKSSSFSKSAADNFSSKAAILYSLTNLTEEEVTVRGWEKFEQSLLMNSEDNNRDYYIIVMNKDNNEFHLTSLKRLNKLTPNGNNLPFQIKWKDNIKTVNRTHDEAYRFIVGCYKESVTKKISCHKLFDVL